MKTLLIVALFLWASTANATVVQTTSLVSAGGVHSSAGAVRLSANVGDVVIGPSVGGTVALWHGFYTPRASLVSGVDVPMVSLRPFLATPMPNPVLQSATTIEYSLASAEQHVTLAIYDVSGRLVRQLISGTQTPGVFQTVWNLRSDNNTRVASGIYFVRLATRSFIQTRRITILR